MEYSANELISRDPRSERGFYMMGGRDPDGWAVDAGGPVFTVLLAIDLDRHSEETIQHLSSRLGRAGMGSLCAWGPGCELVHNIFDLEYIRAVEAGGQRLEPMTTWHDDESLADALWDAMDVSWHAAQENAAPVYIGTDNDDWSHQIRTWLADPDAFRAFVVPEDDGDRPPTSGRRSRRRGALGRLRSLGRSRRAG